MNLSYWEQSTFLQGIDVAIIGSGIVGLNAALAIQEQKPHYKVVVLERGILPAGASTKNGGFACFGSASELLDDLQEQPETVVWQTLKNRWQGLQQLQKRVGRSYMDLEQHGNYELFLPEDQLLYEQCLAKLPYLNQQIEATIGVKNVFDTQAPTSAMPTVKNWIRNRAEGQINTGKLMQRLLDLAHQKGILILNGVTVLALEEQAQKVQISTQNLGMLIANKVLVATNGFATSLLPNLQVLPARNQVLITKPIANLPLQGCFHYQKGYVYFRNIDNRILLGGARHLDLEGEQTTAFGFSENIQTYLTDFLTKVILPNQAVEIDYWWSGIMGVGTHKQPIVQQLSERITVAVRLGGMGIAIGALVGEQGANLVLNGIDEI